MKILVVDDEEAMREVIKQRLQSWGHEMIEAASGVEGGEQAERSRPQVVLSDVVMPDISGIELLQQLKKGNPERPVILMTAHGSVDLAVKAMKEGAQDFLTKPLDYEKLRAVLLQLEEDLERRAQATDIRRQLKSEGGFGPFVGRSPKMKKVYELIEATAESDVALLITGESGTGKELVARTVHQLSKRSGEPFVAVNAAAIPAELMESEIFGHEKGAFTGAADVRAGCFELAHRGTLLLDEIGEMPLELQPKLLRVLEDGKVRRLGGKQEFQFDVRLISSTNQEPQRAIESGQLREDLFYRLNVVNIEVPPLRERTGDVLLLTEHFVEAFAAKHEKEPCSVRAEAMKALESYPWPGNVRELRNVIERAVVLSEGRWVEKSHLPPYLFEPAGGRGAIRFPAGMTAAEAEKQLILATLKRVGNNKAEAARQLDLDVKTIRNKLKSYGITASDEP